MRGMWGMPLVLPLLAGCVAAARGTYHLAQAEQVYAQAQQAEAEEHAVYAWTMAESYMLKAREEYALADYQAAERLAATAAEWADKARAITAARQEALRGTGEPLPEDVQRPAPTSPILENSEEDVEFEIGEGEE